MRTPICRRHAPPATWTAFGLSLAAHLAVMIGFGPFAVSAPRPGRLDSLEVTLLAEAAANPAPKAAAGAATAANSAAREIPDLAEAATGDAAAAPENAGNEPLVESRYDAAALNNPKPPYPLAARRRGAQGRVLLSVQVDTDGRGREVRLKRSSGHAVLDDAALRTVQRWRFVPARRGDTPVESWVDVPILFRLES